MSAAGWVALVVLVGGSLLLRVTVWAVDARRYGRHS